MINSVEMRRMSSAPHDSRSQGGRVKRDNVRRFLGRLGYRKVQQCSGITVIG